MIKKKFRICKNTSFQEIIANKDNFVKNDEFILYFKNNNLNHIRVGISVYSKVKNAVLRNKIKRQVRSILSNVLDYNKNIDIVIIVREKFIKNKYQQNFNSIKKKISELLWH